MAARLTPNELRELQDRYGSVEAIVSARPDLADWFAARREATESTAKLLAVPPEPPEAPESLRLPTVGDEFEAALDRHTRKRTPKPKSGRRKYASQEFPQRLISEVERRLGAGETLTDIAADVELDRKLVAKIRDAAKGEKWQIVTGKTAGMVALVAMSSTPTRPR